MSLFKLFKFKRGPNIKPEEAKIVILVLGLAGDGKSTFINAATGTEGAPTSTLLEPCTTKAQDFVCQHYDSKIVFIDTPGLDLDGGLEAVAAEVRDILLRYNRSHVDGIVYLHESSRKVITRPPEPRSVVTKFQALCGPNWQSHTILAVRGGAAESHQLRAALQAIYYAGMKVAPFTVSAQGSWNAWDVLNQVITVAK